MRITICLLGVLALLMNCSSQNASVSTVEDVEDIVSMVSRSDGNFDVVCRDGSREVATPNDIRSGRVCGGGNNPQPDGLICVARDNDNRDPWVMALFTEEGRIEQIRGYQFDTKGQCENAVADGETFGPFLTMLCVARDNDNRDPWIRISIDHSDGSVKVHASQFDTYSTCVASMTQGRKVHGGILSCVARDNDNRDPWIFSGLCVEGEARINGPLFDQKSNCQRALNDGRETRTSLLVCVARDNDNRDPWIIASVKLNGEYTANTETQFDTYSDCLNTLRGGGE